MLLSLNYLLGLGAWLAGMAALFIVLLRWRQVRRLGRKPLHGPHAGLAAWMLLAALTLPEVACALFYDATDAFSQTNVSRRWFDRHVVPNKAGYRDARELPVKRSAVKRYVLFTGDSFTFGHGLTNVADRFSDRIAGALEADDVVVSNTGLPGMEIKQIVDGQLPQFSQDKTPVDVLVYTFVPNDIECYDERTAAFYERLASRDSRFFLWRNTYFYNLLYHRVQPMFAGSGEDYYSFLAASYSGEPWELFARKLKKMDAWCRTNHARLHVMIFPFLTSLGDSDPFTPAYELLETYCREEGIACTNLTPVMTAHRSEGLVVSRFDSHPNARAHALAAETFLPVLKSQLSELKPSSR